VSFAAGDAVRVSARAHSGHHRTPGYLKGRRGTVERVHASFTNPETRAYGGDGLPRQGLYLVRFDQHELWQTYVGEHRDALLANVFEHWLEADR
jgi:Nitrile hydratase beta subunit, C-terminal